MLRLTRDITMLKLLLIDDDSGITTALTHALATSYELDIARTGTGGLHKADTFHYDVILLDLKLPDMTGLDVCERLRRSGVTAPILILSGETKVLSKVSLLDAGADDYLTKPFSLGELKARLRVLSRRVETTQPKKHRLQTAGLTLDSDTHRVTRAGQTIKLRRKEFAMLECLMLHAGSVVSRNTLTNHAWRENEDPWTNTIDVHIKYLRDKIDRPFDTPLIKTVHGLGYKLEVSVQTSKPL
ncbi:MAG: response regulator transcription factor [Candidatus Saccharibacteria bacterium]